MRGVAYDPMFRAKLMALHEQGVPLTTLSAEFGVDLNHETIRMWLKGELQPAPKRMLVIEAATGGKVTRYHQRPDIFGPAPKSKPKKRRAA